jgi:16S rRNA processing protein RimM
MTHSDHDLSAPQPETDDGSAGQKSLSEPDFLAVGKILRPHGVRGELKIAILTHYPDWLSTLDVIYLGNAPDQFDNVTEYELVGTRRHRNHLLIKLKGVLDRNAADLLRQKFVMIRLDQSIPLEDDEFYTFEILGMAVYTDRGDYLGDVKEIMETGANDVFILEGGPHGTLLIPDTEEVIQAIDPDTRQIVITPLPGLLPDQN